MLCWKSPGTLESSALMMAQPVAIYHALLFDSPTIIPVLFILFRCTQSTIYPLTLTTRFRRVNGRHGTILAKLL
jgi:hypothetical protein